MQIKVLCTPEPRRWFAWYPVLAERKSPLGIMYFWVWLKVINRSYLRVGGMSQWVYTT